MIRTLAVGATLVPTNTQSPKTIDGFSIDITKEVIYTSGDNPRVLNNPNCDVRKDIAVFTSKQTGSKQTEIPFIGDFLSTREAESNGYEGGTEYLDFRENNTAKSFPLKPNTAYFIYPLIKNQS